MKWIAVAACILGAVAMYINDPQSDGAVNNGVLLILFALGIAVLAA